MYTVINKLYLFVGLAKIRTLASIIEYVHPYGRSKMKQIMYYIPLWKMQAGSIQTLRVITPGTRKSAHFS